MFVRDPQRFASHDIESLARHVAAAGATAAGAKRAASLAIARVFREGGALDQAFFDEAEVSGRARAALAALETGPSLRVDSDARSDDGARRLLLRCDDGALIESVVIPGPSRTTLCVSSQVGCARACTFCETGAHGLTRPLSAAEMIDEVRLARDAAGAIRNVVFMGMGEPFDNLDEVLRAIRLLTDGRAFGFAPSRVTVSTVGVADKLEAFFRGCRAELAVSLNAPDDERRASIMPVNARFPLGALKEAIVRALPPRRRVFFEYVLFDGFNDAERDADMLARYVEGLRCRVNVIPCNPGPDARLRPPSDAALDRFVKRLSSHGVTTLVRRPRGRDVGGACGQLAGARRLELVNDARAREAITRS